MTLHCLIAGRGTIAYIIAMFFLLRDFGRPPNHMAMVSPEGIAMALSFIFLIAVVLVAVPVFVLLSRQCRLVFGISRCEVGMMQETSDEDASAVSGGRS